MKLFKSRKTYYLYNPNTLSYERFYPSAKDRFFGVLRHLSIGIVIGAGIFFIFLTHVRLACRIALKKENKLLQTQYEVLSLRLNNALEVLDDIQQRDENLYRAIFQAESIPESVRKSGFGGTNRYEHLMSLSNPRTGRFDHPARWIAEQNSSYPIQLAGRTHHLGQEPRRTKQVHPRHTADCQSGRPETHGIRLWRTYRPDLPYSTLPLRHGLFRQSGYGNLCHR